jgi:hypothetical protein
MSHRAILVFLLLGAGLSLSGEQAAAPPAATKKPPKTKPADRPPLDFSGVWEVDPRMSSGGSWRMGGAVLSVKQRGNRIYIEPIESKTPRLLAEEIIADGRQYEKMLGPAGKGVVTAQWAKDGKSLLIEVTAGPPENPGEAVQHSIWSLSSDGSVWVRESVSVSKGTGGRSRVVFRKRGPVGMPTRTPRP